MHRIKLVEDAAGGKLSRYPVQAQPTALGLLAGQRLRRFRWPFDSGNSFFALTHC